MRKVRKILEFHFEESRSAPAQELARACPDTRVVTVCDREGDFRELISRAKETGVALPEGGDADLWDHVLETDPVGGRRIEVPASYVRRIRNSRRWCRVWISWARIPVENPSLACRRFPVHSSVGIPAARH